MISSIYSFVCSCSLTLLYINILALLFMSRSLIGAAEWETPILTPTILTQYYELRARLFYSANYSYNITQNKIVIVHQFTLTYSEFLFCALVVLLCGVYLTVLLTTFIVTLFREIGIIHAAHAADCPICMESMRRFVRVSLLPCGHMFCKTCLQLWLGKFRYDTCPMCRRPVQNYTPSDSMRLELLRSMFNVVLQELSDNEFDNEFLY